MSTTGERFTPTCVAQRQGRLRMLARAFGEHARETVVAAPREGTRKARQAQRLRARLGTVRCACVGDCSTMGEHGHAPGTTL